MSGVELGEGEVATAPVVVSNLDPTTTFTHLLDADSLPEGFAAPGRRHRPPRRLFPGPLRSARAARVPRTLRGAERHHTGPQRHVLRHGGADAAGLRGVRAGPGPRVAELQPADPLARRSDARPRGDARRQQLRLLPADRRPRDAGPAPRRDGRADRGQDRLGRPELPGPHRAPAQLPRLHLRVDVRLCRRGLHPRAAPARVHGAVPAGADGMAGCARARRRVSTSAGPGATAAPVSRSSPATTAATPCSTERATGCSAAGAP